MKACFLICVCLSCLGLPLVAADTSPLLFISNETLSVGVLPKAGGRIVELRESDSENLLLADEAAWHQPAWKEITITPYRWGVYPLYYGHSMWLGPQSQWYKQQDIYDYMQDKSWPPDKHLNVTTYSVLEHNPQRIVLQGPASPISGVQMQKAYEIIEGKLHITVRAKNVSQRTHKWTLWSLTRIPGSSQVWVHPGTEQRYEYGDKPGIKMQMQDYKSWHYLAPVSLKAGQQRNGKYFSDCTTPVLFAFHKQRQLAIHFDKVERSQLPADHSNVEIFMNQNDDPKRKSMIELEHHGAYLEIAPGEEIVKREQWSVRKSSAEIEAKREQQYQAIQDYLGQAVLAESRLK